MKRLLFWSMIALGLAVSSFSFALANPASEKCAADWWISKISKDDLWNEYGKCVFSNGIVCDERAYYNWTCSSWITTTWANLISSVIINTATSVVPTTWSSWNITLSWVISTWVVMTWDSWVVLSTGIMLNAWYTGLIDDSVKIETTCVPNWTGDWCTEVSWYYIPWADLDMHWCKWSAWYSRNETLQKCIRSWELYNINFDGPQSISLPYINAQYLSFINSEKAQFIKDAIDAIKYLSWEDNNKPELYLISKILQNKDDVISIKILESVYLWWAHAIHSIKTLNYYTKNPQLITLYSLFKNPQKSLNSINKSLNSYFAKQLWADSDKQWIKDWLKVDKNLSNYQNFTVSTKNGKINTITFYFDDYQIVPYVFWQPQITLSYPSLKILK